MIRQPHLLKALAHILISLLLASAANAFLSSVPTKLAVFIPRQAPELSPFAISTRKQSYLLSSFFGDIGKFFEEFGGKGDESKSGDDEEDEDEDYVGSTRLLSIPVQSIKPGGLRLLLMFYLMGMQNTPDRGSWTPDQPSKDEYQVDMYYHDRSAAIIIRLLESEITIDRMGSAPSMSYLMQETIIVDGVLDELQACVFEGDIAEEDRLLVLAEPKDAINKARESLAFS